MEQNPYAEDNSHSDDIKLPVFYVTSVFCDCSREVAAGRYPDLDEAVRFNKAYKSLLKWYVEYLQY